MSEKEQLAKWMIAWGFTTGHGDTVEDLLRELGYQIAELKRKTIWEYSSNEPA